MASPAGLTTSTAVQIVGSNRTKHMGKGVCGSPRQKSVGSLGPNLQDQNSFIWKRTKGQLVIWLGSSLSCWPIFKAMNLRVICHLLCDLTFLIFTW